MVSLQLLLLIYLEKPSYNIHSIVNCWACNQLNYNFTCIIWDIGPVDLESGGLSF